MGKQLRKSSTAIRGAAASGVLFALLGVACSSWEQEYVYSTVSGTGRVSFLDGGSLALDADLELLITASHAQSVALDGLCVSIGTSWDQLQDVSIDEVDLDDRAWPVELDESDGLSAVRSMRVRGKALMPEDSPYHPCRSGSVMMQAAASFVSSEFGKVPGDCRHGGTQIDVALELDCPPCEDPFAPLGLQPTWEKTRTSFSPIEASTAVVDGEGAVWRLSQSTLLRTRPDDEALAEAESSQDYLDVSGRVALAGGSLPGVVYAHAAGESYVVDDSGEVGAGGSGGGGGGGGSAGGGGGGASAGGGGGGEPEVPASSFAVRTLHIGRTVQGTQWVRGIEVADYEVDLVAPVVAVAAGKVLLMVHAPRGLYVDSARVAESGLYLAVFDELSGQLLDHVELAEPVVAAHGLTDGGFVAVVKSSSGLYELVRFDVELQPSWVSPLPDEPVEGGAFGPELLAVDSDGFYWRSPRGLLHRVDAEGQHAWRVTVSWPITSMAVAPDGGLLITQGSSTLARIDQDGVLRAVFSGPAYPFCSFGLLLASGGREPAYLRTTYELSVGRLTGSP